MSKRPAARTRFVSKGLVVLYDDKDIIVIDKPVGLLTVATEREKSRTVHSLLTDYVRRGCGKCRKQVFVVHRLDRDTSGLLIFAKSEEAMLRLKDHWKENEKKYLAVVHGRCEKSSGTITSYLAEDKNYNVYQTSDETKGRLSHTIYMVLRTTKRFSLLEVTLLTGRKNQIRVHLAGIGHPIVGDEKYGNEAEPQQRMALHARSLSFNHPFTGKRLSFESDVPPFFMKLVGSFDPRDEQARPLPMGEETMRPAPERGKPSPGEEFSVARPAHTDGRAETPRKPRRNKARRYPRR